MAQDHLDTLSAVDASFLHQEGANTHMHIGGIALLEGPPPEYTDLLGHIRSRLHLVPRYRQKLAAPPFGLGRWRWIDDPSFNLEYHVRHTRCRRRAPRTSSTRSPRACSASAWTAPSPCGSCGSSRASTMAAGRSSPRPTTASSTASRAST